MPRSSREKSEETRVRILEAAYRLFLERGYHGASMRDVSRSAGLTVGAIYNHFPTKEDLWREVLIAKHPYRDIFPMIQASQGESIAELVRSAAGLMIQTLVKRPDLLNLMFIEIVEFNSQHIPDLFQVIYPEVIKLGVTLAKKDGKLREIPTPVMVRSFVGFFFSYYVTGLLMKGVGFGTIDPQSLDQFVDMFLYGVLAEDDPTRAQRVQSHTNLPSTPPSTQPEA